MRHLVHGVIALNLFVALTAAWSAGGIGPDEFHSAAQNRMGSLIAVGVSLLSAAALAVRERRWFLGFGLPAVAATSVASWAFVSTALHHSAPVLSLHLGLFAGLYWVVSLSLLMSACVKHVGRLWRAAA